MTYFDEYAADRRAALSRARLPAKWRPWMKQWSVLRRSVWKIDSHWSAYLLLAHVEILKGEHEWAPLAKEALPEIVLIDECVADLVGCSVVHDVWNHDCPTRHEGSDPFPYLSMTLWDDNEEEQFEDDQGEEDRKLEEKINIAREREGGLVLVHYLLPHIRLYGKRRALELSERAYFYRLNSALRALSDDWHSRVRHLEKCAVIDN